MTTDNAKLSEAELEELEALERKATPGPWKFVEGEKDRRGGLWGKRIDMPNDTWLAEFLWKTDQPFILALRNAFPRLLAMARGKEPVTKPVAWLSPDKLYPEIIEATANKAIADDWRARGWEVVPLYEHPNSPPEARAKAAPVDRSGGRGRLTYDKATGTVKDGNGKIVIDHVEEANML